MDSISDEIYVNESHTHSDGEERDHGCDDGEYINSCV